jgi:hypothetical protein
VLAHTRFDPLKNKLELTVVSEFLLATGFPYRILRAGTPPEPDVICEYLKGPKQLGIEVVTSYYDEEHAKSVWKPARGKKAPDYCLTRPDSEENVRVLAESVRVIKAKRKKKYLVKDNLLLVVLTYPRRLYLCQVEERLVRLRTPRHHPFDEIYLMSQHGEVYRLFPTNEWILR